MESCGDQRDFAIAFSAMAPTLEVGGLARNRNPSQLPTDTAVVNARVRGERFLWVDQQHVRPKRIRRILVHARDVG